jgi:hypothetical protein
LQDHLDDLDLLAYASGLRPRDERTAHLDACAHCRARQARLVRLMASLPTDDEASAAAVPSWEAVKPAALRRVTPSRGARRLRLGLAAAALLLFLGWPEALWPNAPIGPVALMVMAFGHQQALKPVKAPSGSVAIRWNPATGWAELVADRLPPLPPHHVYQVWRVTRSRHISAAVFVADARGRAFVWMRSLKDFQGVKAVGITVEPAPGSPSPTGPRQLFGAL